MPVAIDGAILREPSHLTFRRHSLTDCTGRFLVDLYPKLIALERQEPTLQT
jgi:hypothetical protein